MTDKISKLRRLRSDLDKGDMLGLVESFARHMGDAWQIGGDFSSRLRSMEMRRVVVCGMGGSAIAGDMVRSFSGNRLSLPLHVLRDFEIPLFLQDYSFFIVSSYSGNTSETLSVYKSLRARGAYLVAITSGGELAELCERDGVPCCRIPGGMPPRAAIAYSLFPTIRILQHFGILRLEEGEFDQAQVQLQDLCERYSLMTEGNLAADIAYQLSGKLPFVYSCGGLLEAVSKRWCCQFNENSKTLSHCAIFPELSHNEVVGWESLREITSRIAIIVLEDEEDHALSKKQREIVLELVSPLSGVVRRVSSGKGPRLSRILAAMILGDFVSVYLALLNGVDPTPVEKITFLKERLSAIGP